MFVLGSESDRLFADLNCGNDVVKLGANVIGGFASIDGSSGFDTLSASGNTGSLFFNNFEEPSFVRFEVCLFRPEQSNQPLTCNPDYVGVVLIDK